MTDYRRMYYRLFNRVSEVICELQEAQREAEEMFLNQREASGTGERTSVRFPEK